ncbi:J domain-containing protein [Vannielia litorea]|uniref:J domain-containing protein n=1 Tax=Vannielia litorea TaxID=1217970 RepID=UPI001BCAA299|nr:J domain-containing protein [Vannielia litorea]MBS8227135.1 J domain-containing protein [Vannielia litorea]
MEDAYPLQWPAGRSRTPASQRVWGPFKGTPDAVQKHMRDEIARMGGRQVVVSTNKPVRRDGGVYANAREPDDPGVAVYFERNGDRVCFACDQYDRVWKNMRAIAKTIEAMRGIERWGSKEMLDRAFTGFAALPPPDAHIEMPGPQSLPKPWHEVLGVSPAATWSEIRTAYREAIREADDEMKLALNLAYEQAKTPQSK